MSWTRAVGRALLGPLLATLIAITIGSLSLTAISAMTSSLEGEAGILGEMARAFSLFLVMGLIIAGTPSFILAIPVWAFMDRRTLTPGRGGLVGGGVGGVAGLIVLGVFVPIGLVAGYLGGRWSVRLVDQWLPRQPE